MSDARMEASPQISSPQDSSPQASSPKAEATRRQGLASDPAHSAWVSANAGSGKTHVLARRVIRLLLAGTQPSRILCLTYTKAAAANMSNRVLAMLGRWVSLSDAELDEALRETDGGTPTPQMRARARRLFAAALETPGGLKIQTIHAFCGGLLHRFPFEAGVAAGFRELDEVGRAELMARIRERIIIEAASDLEAPLGRALVRMMEDLSDAGISAMLEAAVAVREKIGSLGPDEEARHAALAGALGVLPHVSPASIRKQMLDGPNIPYHAWEEIAGTLSTSDKKTDRDRAAALLAAYAADNEEEAVAHYTSLFLTKERTPRSDRAFLTKFIQTNHAGLYESMVEERERIVALEGELRAAAILERTEAALTLGAEACRRYEAEKAARGLLDFDDLIARASSLLNTVPSSFVHYKLDQGIDHVLVDEAQDTSPAQWQVVHGLTSDFFSGEGAREGVTRTIFVVGDEKQSIFSFQGADPRAFGGMRAEFMMRAGDQGFRKVELPHSFRSAPGVLEAVDRIFAADAAKAGLTLDDTAPAHAAIRADAPALVEIWPTTCPAEVETVDDWRRPLDEVAADDPVNQLARRVAAFVQAGISAGLPVPSRNGRAMQAGDVLVLVRRRGKAFEAIIRALKELKTVAVAGADRLVVAEHIAAMDLMALGDALLSPDDDLALACVLKSPLFGYTDDDLIALCPKRPGRLMAALHKAGEDAPRHAAVVQRLRTWRKDARALRPFDFYARVLGRDGGRAAMLARLGPEAADVLDEFMTLARTYEMSEPASLAGFLAFLRRGGAETKRDMESGRDEVRVMTVHGAKGLEAPIVILADTVDVPRGRNDGGFLSVADGQGREIPLLAPRKTEDTEALSEARAESMARERAEYRRLLYVALTRAEDALIVCGAETRLPAEGKDHARPEGNWYDLVLEALEPEAARVPALGFEGDVLRWQNGGRQAGGLNVPDTAVRSHANTQPGPEVRKPSVPPVTLSESLPPEPVVRILRPSLAGKGAATGAAIASSDAMNAETLKEMAEILPPLLRGDLVHRLLAGLPDVSPAERETAGLRLLRHAAHGVPEEALHTILAEALGVLAHAPLAPLFGAQSRAEVAVGGVFRGADGARLHLNGRIDRLAVCDEKIIVADFKTDRLLPARAEEIAPAHISQLALYGAALERIFPGKPVEAWLVYTVGPTLFRLDAAALEHEAGRLIPAI
ncbi:double-strand break repair helicase AddA [Xanthobacter sp. TB0139]|uniref:double-strand break repair helicase AddA n=1 Tax=Xanthobacter sp. TB0139 TaxID=3459178 RepID=UPI00403A0AEF